MARLRAVTKLIKEGKLPADFQKNQKDRSFFASDIGHIEEYIRQIVTKAKAKGFTPQDIQVLAPMYRGAAGIDALNKMMQEIFNPNEGKKKEVKWNDTVYRIDRGQSFATSQYARIKCVQWRYGRNRRNYFSQRLRGQSGRVGFTV